MPWILLANGSSIRWKGRRKSMKPSQVAASRFETKWAVTNPVTVEPQKEDEKPSPASEDK